MKKVFEYSHLGGLEIGGAPQISRLGSDRYAIGWMEGLKPTYLYATSHIYFECVVRDISTAKLPIPSRVQRQIMDVLRIKYIKSET